jgi:hypothetical protein
VRLSDTLLPEGTVAEERLRVWAWVKGMEMTVARNAIKCMVRNLTEQKFVSKDPTPYPAD